MATDSKDKKSLNPGSKTFVPSSLSSAAGNAASTAKSAWGSKPLDAVKAAPPPAPAGSNPRTQRPRQSSNGHRDHRDRRDGGGRHGNKGHRDNRGRGGGGKHGGRGGGGGKTYKHNTNLDKVTLCQPGQGNTPAQKAVVRFNIDYLLSQRLEYVDEPEEWDPPEVVRWTDEGRKELLQQVMDKGRTGGEVSKVEKRRSSQVETAPPLSECAPLQVNDETRWKAKVFEGAEAVDEDSDDAVLKKALFILNKLSWTKFEKLSQAFIDTGIGRNEACLHRSIDLIVEKAHQEPHFASMYAQLCAYLQTQHVGGGKKIFKKHLLHRCQEEFEVDVHHKIANATEGLKDAEEIAYHTNLVKKNYLGHMRFIGELYKIDLIKIEIMLWCLKSLLDDTENLDGSLECFTKLMTTSGDILERQSAALRAERNKPEPEAKLNECWKFVDDLLAGKVEGHTPSNRIKFMMLDLKELKNNDWNKRREEEKAMTLKQIQKQVAKEEKLARSASSGQIQKPSLNRRASSGDVRKQQPVVDKDGFTQVPSLRSSAPPAMHRSVSDAAVGYSRGNPNPPKRPTSFSGKTIKEDAPTPPKEEKKVEYFSPEECGNKFKNILKEYFVGGDTDDAVLSVHELICAGNDGSVERGAKAIEQGVLMVMEMKDEQVRQMLAVAMRCLKEEKLEKASVVMGLNDPLEFLSDVEIDAPLAGTHLATIIAELVKGKIVSLDFLLEAPEYFRTDGGKAATLCAKVLKNLEGEVTDSDVDLIEKLMTDDDKSAFASARDLLASA